MSLPKQIRTFRYLASLGVLLALSIVPIVNAAQSSSNNYSVNEVFFGAGGELNSCSATYCSKQSAGELTVGPTGSTSYKAQAGFNTDRTPSLTFVVPAQNVNLGVQTAGTTSTATATFSVYSYLSSGYVVQTVGTGLKNGSYTLHNKSPAGTSNPSTEEFGMNLVANTSPAAFGAAPDQTPNSNQVGNTSFGFGIPASGYDTANNYQYHDGDVIAKSLSSSGITNYTISYILNTTGVTPGGTYTMNQILVATATF